MGARGETRNVIPKHRLPISMLTSRGDPQHHGIAGGAVLMSGMTDGYPKRYAQRENLYRIYAHTVHPHHSGSHKGVAW
jgi:hypothetical protein